MKDKKQKPSEQDQMIRMMAWAAVVVAVLLGILFYMKSLPEGYFDQPANRMVYMTEWLDPENLKRDEPEEPPTGEPHIRRMPGEPPLVLPKKKKGFDIP